MSSKLRMQSQHSELRFMEFLNSIYLSGMAALENRDETPDLSVEQTYNATYKITRAEVIARNKFFKNTDKRMLRKKHKSLLAYSKELESWFETFDDDIEGDPDQLERFCHGFVRIMKDVHSLLNEDTNQKIRDRIVDTIIAEAVAEKFGPVAYIEEKADGYEA